METENPVVTIERNQHWFWGSLFFIILMTSFAIFAVLIPVFSSGDVNAVWPVDNRTGRNTIIFLYSLFWVVLLPVLLRYLCDIGDLLFYNNRLEVHTLLFSRKKIYYYGDITVTQEGSYRVTIRHRNLPGWQHLLKQLKALYIDSIAFSLRTTGYTDPNKLPVALNILKSSTEFIQKRNYT